MRNGVNSKRRFVFSVLQFVCGIVVGHFCFILYNETNKKNISNYYYQKCFSTTSTKNNSYNLLLANYSDGSFNSMEIQEKNELFDEEKNVGDGYDKHKEPLATATKCDDASFSGNFTNNNIKNDLLFIGVLTSNKFLKTRACTVYNTRAKHIQVM